MILLLSWPDAFAAVGITAVCVAGILGFFYLVTRP